MEVEKTGIWITCDSGLPFSSNGRAVREDKC